MGPAPGRCALRVLRAASASECQGGQSHLCVGARKLAAHDACVCQIGAAHQHTGKHLCRKPGVCKRCGLPWVLWALQSTSQRNAECVL